MYNTNILDNPNKYSILVPWSCIISKQGTFKLRAFGRRRFYPMRLTKSTFVEGDSNISLWYIKIGIEQDSSIHNCRVNRRFLAVGTGETSMSSMVTSRSV